MENSPRSRPRANQNYIRNYMSATLEEDRRHYYNIYNTILYFSKCHLLNGKNDIWRNKRNKRNNEWLIVFDVFTLCGYVFLVWYCYRCGSWIVKWIKREGVGCYQHCCSPLPSLCITSFGTIMSSICVFLSGCATFDKLLNNFVLDFPHGSTVVVYYRSCRFCIVLCHCSGPIFSFETKRQEIIFFFTNIVVAILMVNSFRVLYCFSYILFSFFRCVAYIFKLNGNTVEHFVNFKHVIWFSYRYLLWNILNKRTNAA